LPPTAAKSKLVPCRAQTVLQNTTNSSASRKNSATTPSTESTNSKCLRNNRYSRFPKRHDPKGSWRFYAPQALDCWDHSQLLCCARKLRATILDQKPSFHPPDPNGISDLCPESRSNATTTPGSPKNKNPTPKRVADKSMRAIFLF
jgi:hypothetical protein